MSPESARCSVTAIAEDNAHEEFVRAIVDRIAVEVGVKASVGIANTGRGAASYGRGRKRWLRQLQKGAYSLPDALVVVRDGNGGGWNHVRDDERTEILKVLPEVAPILVIACPDPYVERWCLLDRGALRRVFGQALDVDHQQTGTDYFKQRFDAHAAILDTGIEIGATAYIRDIVGEMDLTVAERASSAFSDFVSDLRNQFRRVKREHD